MNEKKTCPLTPREFISAVRDLLGDTYLIKLFGLSVHNDNGRRSLNRWTAKRPYVDEDSVRENWIEKHERLLERLIKEPGGLDIARALVGRHTDIVGCELTISMDVSPDKDSIEEECLDDYPTLIELHNAIRDHQPINVVRHLLLEAKLELDETMALYQMRTKK